MVKPNNLENKALFAFLLANILLIAFLTTLMFL